MAEIAVTINGQTVTRTFEDAKLVNVLSAYAEANGIAPGATVRQKVIAALDTMLADTLKVARDYRRRERIAPVLAQVDEEIVLG